MRIPTKPGTKALTLLAVAGLHLGCLTSEALGQDRLILRGVVRDFRSDHPDFNVAPAEGFGHTPANVSLTLGADKRPIYTGTGFIAATQWRDTQGRPIAPHLYNQVGWGFWVWSNAGVGLGDSLAVANGGLIDSWDSSLGDYADTQGTQAFIALNTDNVAIDANGTVGGSIFVGPDGDPSVLSSGGQVAGYAGALDQPGAIPSITVPTINPNVGNLNVANNSTYVLNADTHCSDFLVRQNGIVEVDGNVTLICDGTMTLRQNAQIKLLPGARLNIYTLSRVDIVYQNAGINTNTEDPSRVMWYHTSTEPFTVEENSLIYATIIAPNAQLNINNNGEVFGKVIADSVEINNNGELHVDTATSTFPTMCGAVIHDTAGSVGAFSKGTITTAYTFGQWFRNAPGTNASKRHDLFLTLAPDGMFEYTSDSFFPVDGKLYGNEGSSNNHYFTYEAPATFTYEACSGQTIVFQGDDDTWIFIDGKLAIDLGGMIANVPQVIELDRLGLTDGEIYDFRLFYAQRQSTSAGFRIRTNISLVPDPYTVGFAGYPDFD